MMKKLASGVAVLLLAACSTPAPHGPGILVLPGSGKNFDQFRFDEQECRGYAQSSTKTAEQSVSATDASIQKLYDHAYTQCMYAKGHRVPVSGRYSDSGRPAPSQSAARTPPPPPPPGQPPPEAPPDYRPK
jgi:hypothetical protein